MRSARSSTAWSFALASTITSASAPGGSSATSASQSSSRMPSACARSVGPVRPLERWSSAGTSAGHVARARASSSRGRRAGAIEAAVVVQVEDHRHAHPLARVERLGGVPHAVVVLQHEPPPHRFGQRVDRAVEPLQGRRRVAVAAAQVQHDHAVGPDAHAVEQRGLHLEVGDRARDDAGVGAREDDVLRRVQRHAHAGGPEALAEGGELGGVAGRRIVEARALGVRGVRREVAGEAPVADAAGDDPVQRDRRELEAGRQRRLVLRAPRVVRLEPAPVGPEHLDGEAEAHPGLSAARGACRAAPAPGSRSRRRPAR